MSVWKVNKLPTAYPIDSQNFRVLTELNAFRVFDIRIYSGTPYGLKIRHGNQNHW